MPNRIDKHYEIDAETGCWNWSGPLSKAGYALGTVQRSRNGIIKQAVAHRVFYEEAKGLIPVGLQIDHLCRNRRCVNPDHLEAVTPCENNRRAAKITMADARAIRQLCANGATRTAVARQFNLSQPYVSRIVSGKRWSE